SFIVWKSQEERKVAALITGSKVNSRYAKAIVEAKAAGEPIEKIVRQARRDGVEPGFIAQIIDAMDNGLDVSV
ncbi:hypothetical protein, partial [Stenotrophomonas maltophilia]|uniref:hypothetical protein n=1 Tax=Stenotrophomonas maltophilia TaxID=40324 RepID=UPI0013DB3715